MTIANVVLLAIWLAVGVGIWFALRSVIRSGRVRAFVSLVTVVALMVALWPSETFRYKLTLTVLDQGVPYSASSVIEATQVERKSCIGAMGSYCYPQFKHRGVAPVVMLPDGAVVFAALGGGCGPAEGECGGQRASRLPWLVYLDRWDLGPGKTMVHLPPRPPRMELSPADRGKRPPIVYVPPQELGPPESWYVGPSSIGAVTNGRIAIQSITIEPTREPVTDWLDPAPVWMAAHRGGPRISEAERQRRIAQGNQEQRARINKGLQPVKDVLRSSTPRSNLETSTRNQ